MLQNNASSVCLDLYIFQSPVCACTPSVEHAVHDGCPNCSSHFVARFLDKQKVVDDASHIRVANIRKAFGQRIEGRW